MADVVSSEWNEQQLFAEQYFKWTHIAKIAQFNRDVHNWRKALEIKMSFLLGIRADKKKEINKLRLVVNDAQVLYNNCNKNNVSQKGKLLDNMIDTLFYAEAEIDGYCNEKMPFLKMGEDMNIEEF